MPTTTHTLEGADLPTLLERVPTELGAEATIVAANRLRRGGLGGFFARELFEVVVEVPEGAAAELVLDEPADPAPPTTAPRLSTDAVGFAGVLDRMVRDAGIDDAGPRTVGPTMARTVPAAPAPGPVEPGPDAPTAAELPAPAPPPEPEPFVPAGLPAAARLAEPRALEANGVDRQLLARVGVPEEVAARLLPAAANLEAELRRLMERLPRVDPLPIERGSVIAVVGDRADALEVAEGFADALGTNPEEILVAGPSVEGGRIPYERWVTSVEAAHERRRSWGRRSRPTILVVESAPDRRQGGWATHLLEAAGPTMVWGVVDATRKSEDIAAWSDRLGGLDALAVNGLTDTESPAAVLATGIPVGLLDGRPASAARWAVLLTEQLAVAA